MKGKSYKDQIVEQISYALKAAMIKHSIDANQITTDKVGDITYYLYEKKVILLVEWNGFKVNIYE